MQITRRGLTTGTLAVFATASVPGISNVMAAIEPVTIPARKIHIFPDVMYCERQTVFEEENTKTIIYTIMNRWDFDNQSLYIASVGTDRYEEWLKEMPPKNGIPPHIQFGGAIVSGESDPTFYHRWEARTRAHLRSGVLA